MCTRSLGYALYRRYRHSWHILIWSRIIRRIVCIFWSMSTNQDSLCGPLPYQLGIDAFYVSLLRKACLCGLWRLHWLYAMAFLMIRRLLRAIRFLLLPLNTTTDEINWPWPILLGRSLTFLEVLWISILRCPLMNNFKLRFSGTQHRYHSFIFLPAVSNNSWETYYRPWIMFIDQR